MSDAVLVFRDIAAKNEQELARHFLQMLGLAYRSIELPESEYRDWAWRAEQTLADLQHSPQATERHFGHRYAKPYVEGEVPDAMVQLSLVAALHEYGKWLGEPTSLEGAFRKGVEKFYDPKVGTLRRFLPGVDGGKDPDAVDSWYLYHPLVNLARLALDGDEKARDLLLKSADYGIKAARHFKYLWPIEYRIGDFSLITPARDERGFGQTDVNGLYAYLMMQLYQLTSEQHYVQEARAAIEAAKGLRFDLLYQANISVWGAVACMRLWRITDDKDYLDQSYVYLAGFFHNCEIWESQIGHAVHYKNFLGATCLHDAPYMAMYECFECFLGLEEYLTESGPELDPAVRMLAANIVNIRSTAPGSTSRTYCPRRYCTRANTRAGPSTASSPFPWKTSTETGRPQARSARKSMARAAHSSSPHGLIIISRVRRSSCSATSSCRAANGRANGPTRFSWPAGRPARPISVWCGSSATSSPR